MFSNVKMPYFRGAFERAREDSDLIREATSEFSPERGTRYYSWSNGFEHAGFAIRSDGELVFVFSTVKGKGDEIVTAAIEHGATYLDCFDGHLTALYGRHGFYPVATVPNWTPGQPDVVYMALEGYASRHGIEASA
jgi:hypothetical protein